MSKEIVLVDPFLSSAWDFSVVLGVWFWFQMVVSEDSLVLAVELWVDGMLKRSASWSLALTLVPVWRLWRFNGSGRLVRGFFTSWRVWLWRDGKQQRSVSLVLGPRRRNLICLCLLFQKVVSSSVVPDCSWWDSLLAEVQPVGSWGLLLILVFWLYNPIRRLAAHVELVSPEDDRWTALASNKIQCPEVLVSC
jgi:hypothetical protein